MLDIFTQPLRDLSNWMAADTSNYATYFVIVGLVLVLGFIGIALASKQIGKKDERTSRIYSSVNFDMLVILGVASSFFVSSIPTESDYIQQLYLLVFAVTALGGALSGFIRNNLSLR